MCRSNWACNRLMWSRSGESSGCLRHLSPPPHTRARPCRFPPRKVTNVRRHTRKPKARWRNSHGRKTASGSRAGDMGKREDGLTRKRRRHEKNADKEMAVIKYTVKLTEHEQYELHQLITVGKASARKLMHARILLKADESAEGAAWSDQRKSLALEASLSTIARVRQRFVEQGLQEAINRRPQPERPHKRNLDGEAEAHLVALTCGPKPDGEGRWTVRLLAEKLVALGYVDQVCLDETSKQLVSETRTPLPMQPGEPERYDYEYERQGVCNVFLACEPLTGKRFVKITAKPNQSRLGPLHPRPR